MILRDPRISRKQKGFTAVEIAMVASVIAILALLILPIFRQRAEEARVAAVQDELQSLAKALLLVEADMPAGFVPRLSDLDNPENTELSDTDPINTNVDPPRARWRRGLSPADPGFFEEIPLVEYFSTIVPNWRGPYIAAPNTIPLATVRDGFPLLTDQNQGPIAVFTPGIDAGSVDIDRYPIDPWGTPYLLFGQEETIYNVRTLYSLGPNGVPSNDFSGNPANYDRRTGLLGTGDDFEFQF